MPARMLMAIGWPAFLAACVLETAVFALVDPAELALVGAPLGCSRQAVYTLAFFAFWLVGLGASGLSVALMGAASRPEPRV